MPVHGSEVVVQSVQMALERGDCLEEFQPEPGVVGPVSPRQVGARPLGGYPTASTGVAVDQLRHLPLQLGHVVPHVAELGEPVKLLKGF